MDYSNLTPTEKKELLFAESVYVSRGTAPFNINADFLKYNSETFVECCRELFVSLFPMLPLLEKTVALEDADYILYSHPYARIEDMSPVVLSQLREIDERRRPGAEIIVVGKASNAKELLAGSIQNITFWPNHYAEMVGKKFNMNITDEYFVYDQEIRALNIWPVNGCLRKCKFCRRTYMDIPFESLSLEYIKSKLDWYRENCPERLEYIQLRAENLTEYGYDLDSNVSLADLIDLVSSYAEVRFISILIGLAICEITDEILDAMCRSGKFVFISMNPEAGNDRLLRVIGKDHTCERAIYITKRLKESNPNVFLNCTVMVGLPTETLSDVYDLADLCVKMSMNEVLINKYGVAPKLPLNDLPQLSHQLKEYHLRLMIKLIKEKMIASGNDDFLCILYHKKDKKGARKVFHNMTEAALKFGKVRFIIQELGVDIFSPVLGRFIRCNEEMAKYLPMIRGEYLQKKANNVAKQN